MAKKEFLEHRVLGHVEVKDAYITDAGNKVLSCLTTNKETRLLLVEPTPQYWASDAKAVLDLFVCLSRDHARKVKLALAKARHAEYESIKRRGYLSPEIVNRAAEFDAQEIRELETNDDGHIEDGHIEAAAD